MGTGQPPDRARIVCTETGPGLAPLSGMHKRCRETPVITRDSENSSRPFRLTKHLTGCWGLSGRVWGTAAGQPAPPRPPAAPRGPPAWPRFRSVRYGSRGWKWHRNSRRQRSGPAHHLGRRRGVNRKTRTGGLGGGGGGGMSRRPWSQAEDPRPCSPRRPRRQTPLSRATGRPPKAGPPSPQRPAFRARPPKGATGPPTPEPPVAMATGQAPLQRPGRGPVRARLPERASRGLRPGLCATAERPAPGASPRAARTHLQPSPPPPRGSGSRSTRRGPSRAAPPAGRSTDRAGPRGAGPPGAGPAETKAGSSCKPTNGRAETSRGAGPQGEGRSR